MTEEKVIDGFENYSIDVNCVIKNLKTQKALRPRDNGRGYLCVRLWGNNKGTNKKVHRLLAEAFLPNLEEKEHINHIDNDPKNNNLSNLEWCTRSENMKHASRQGRLNNSDGKHKGSLSPSAKLTNEDVLAIKRLLTEGVTLKKLSALFGISQTTISYIKTGRRWSHIQLT